MLLLLLLLLLLLIPFQLQHNKNTSHMHRTSAIKSAQLLLNYIQSSKFYANTANIWKIQKSTK